MDPAQPKPPSPGLDEMIGRLGSSSEPANSRHSTNAQFSLSNDDFNPFAAAPMPEPVMPVRRRLSIGEWIGAIIGAMFAAGLTFFATCAGGLMVAETIPRELVQFDGALAILIVAGLILPTVMAVIVFMAVIRAARK